MIPVEGRPGLARDPKSGAILNINSTEIQAARARKIAMKKEKKRQRQVYEDVETLKTDMADIKELLLTIKEKL
jgi:translation initiation factor 1 (eIF-1/SUI1)